MPVSRFFDKGWFLTCHPLSGNRPRKWLRGRNGDNGWRHKNQPLSKQANYVKIKYYGIHQQRLHAADKDCTQTLS